MWDNGRLDIRDSADLLKYTRLKEKIFLYRFGVKFHAHKNRLLIVLLYPYSAELKVVGKQEGVSTY
jgi:hypothetical protein